MYDVIEKYVENENKNGLLLVDMPTGSGKTYSAIQFIYNSCRNKENAKRKYIFVTTLKKNLPWKDLRKHFEMDGEVALYKEKVLVIDSNVDSVIDGWSDEVEDSIPNEIKKTDEYKKFKSDLKFVKQYRENKDNSLRDLISSIEESLRTKSEPRFRRMLSEVFCKQYRSVNDRIMAIKTEKNGVGLVKFIQQHSQEIDKFCL